MSEYIPIAEALRIGFCKHKCKNATKKDPACKAERRFTEVPEGYCVVIRETREDWVAEMKKGR